MEKPLGVLILAAGLGKRMASRRAKVLHELGGEPLIARVVRAVAPLEATSIVVVVGHDSERVKATVRAATIGDRPVFASQTRQQGTGDAVRCGLEAISDFHGDIIIVCGDCPRLRTATLARFAEAHRRAGASLSFISAQLDDPGQYGRVVRSDSGAVRAIVEARDASADELEIDEVNTGVYIAEASWLREALSELRPDNAQGEWYLTDLVGLAARRGFKVEVMVAREPEEFIGINSREELANMEARLREEIGRSLMKAGVTLIDPASAFVGEQVQIGADTVIGPNVQIMGRCRIGSAVVIEGTAWLRDVTIGDRCHLKLGVRAEDCRIGDDCEVGPFAHLRPGTVLEGHNRIGNFVETKNARIGRGSKASHLSYLGDAVIGKETNIGCGVITVNYDGYDKHTTEIGDRCMVGCDSQLVAPVRIGDDAYVASGSTIGREVPSGALAMSHHPQREKPGWTAQWRRRHEGNGPRRHKTGRSQSD